MDSHEANHCLQCFASLMCHTSGPPKKRADSFRVLLSRFGGIIGIMAISSILFNPPSSPSHVVSHSALSISLSLDPSRVSLSRGRRPGPGNWAESTSSSPSGRPPEPLPSCPPGQDVEILSGLWWKGQNLASRTNLTKC